MNLNYPGLTLTKAPDSFEVRKAALDAAVMHHDEIAADEAVIASAVKFEAYLRHGVTTEADAAEDAKECRCFICTLRGELEKAMSEREQADEPDVAEEKAAEESKAEPESTTAG